MHFTHHYLWNVINVKILYAITYSQKGAGILAMYVLYALHMYVCMYYSVVNYYYKQIVRTFLLYAQVFTHRAQYTNGRVQSINTKKVLCLRPVKTEVSELCGATVKLVHVRARIIHFKLHKYVCIDMNRFSFILTKD